MEFNIQNNDEQFKQNMTINSYKQTQFTQKQPILKSNRYTMDFYMKKNKKITKIHYIIPQHRAHLLQLSEKYTENESILKTEVQKNNKDKSRLFDQTLVYFRALSNPQSNPQNYLSQNNSQQFSLQIQNDQVLNKDASFSMHHNSNQSQYQAKQDEKYRQTYASSFKSQGRDNYYKLQEKNLDFPSPAEYLINIGFQQKRYINLFKNCNNSFTQDKIKKETPEPKKICNKNISEIIYDNRFFLQNYVEQNKSNSEKIYENDFKSTISSKKNNRNTKKSHMFVDNDRDRYGNHEQTSTKNKVSPSSAQYQVDHYTIEKKYQIIKQQQDQKKLLKLWLKPKQVLKS